MVCRFRKLRKPVAHHLTSSTDKTGLDLVKDRSSAIVVLGLLQIIAMT